jgi:hypothetical protein
MGLSVHLLTYTTHGRAGAAKRVTLGFHSFAAFSYLAYSV